MPASFQHAVIASLLTRAARPAEQMGARTLIVSGGVACNYWLRSAAFPKVERGEASPRQGAIRPRA